MATLVPRIYQGFRGVDFRGEECELFRSPDSVNMWKDYKETDSIRTRPVLSFLKAPGLEDTPYPVRVNGIYFYKDAVFVHAGQYLYKYKPIYSEKETILPYTPSLDDGAMSETYWLLNKKSHGFVYADKLYIMDGYNYYCYDGEEISKVEGYVPTTTIGRNPAGGGTPHEGVNFLSDYRINSFLADGESFQYHLDAQNIDSDFHPVATVNGKQWGVGCNFETGVVSFTSPPPKPDTDGQDNVIIKFKKKVDGYRNRILGCTLSQMFDNRVFVTGNPDYPNTVWHCSLNDPTYFSDWDYYREGLDDAKITGMVAGNNALWVFREPSDANTTVFYHTPTIDDQYGKIYPSTHSSVSLGCVGAAINFNDDIVFFSQRGMEGISGDVTTEQVAAHRSSLVDKKLLSEENYKNMILAEWEGYLMVFIGSRVYLADSRTAFQYENHIEYEWFYWELEYEVDYAKVYDGKLYLGMGHAIYTMTSATNVGVNNYWVTPKDKFQYPNKLKTTSKRGCVAEATGDVSVYVKTDKTDFEQVGTYTNVKDYFVSRIKMKKFKDLQLKFASSARFSLESVTLEAFVGGYIKR